MAALSVWHDDHAVATSVIRGVSALPAHVVLEAYSVLTRLPAGLAVSGVTASDVLTRSFPDHPLQLSARDRRTIIGVLAEAGVTGAATYDAVIGLEAAAHDQPLLTLDRRAQETYRRLGVPFRAI